MSFLKKYKKQLIKYIFVYTVSIAIYFVSFLLFSFIIALICKNTETSENIVSILTYIFAAVSAVLCGFASGKILKEKGFLTGIILSIILFVLKIIISLFVFDRSIFLDNYYMVICIDTLGILIGCIFGVNKKPKKYY